MLTDMRECNLRTDSVAIRCAVLSALALGIAQSVPAFSQTTPNWGAGASQTQAEATATDTAPWGGPGAAPPAPERQLPPRAKTTHTAISTAMPAALTELLRHPDSETVALAGGQKTTVKQIRDQANLRRTVIAALKTGEVPVGRKRMLRATARVQQYQELINSSASLKDASHREASAEWATPGSLAKAQTRGGDPAAAWATPASIAEVRANASKWGSTTHNGDATTLQSGVGNSSLSKTGSALARSTRPAVTSVSQAPAAVFVAQNAPAGIALVNGHDKGVQITPGGLYTVVGKGFGSAVGAVDIIGTHLPGGRLELQVTQWRDGQVQVQLREPISGVADQPATLRVTSHDGTLFMMPVQFYATRQQLTIADTDVDLTQAFDLTLGNTSDWDSVLTADGQIVRAKSGDNIDCPSTGQDTVRTKLPAGWSLVELSVDSWLPTQSDPNKDFYGQGGDTVISGSYALTQIPAGLMNQMFVVHWGVLRSHSTNGPSLLPKYYGNDYGWSGNDACVSGYGFVLTVVGPAGLRPF